MTCRMPNQAPQNPLGSQLRNIRKLAGRTIAHVAAEARIRPATLGDIETGKRQGEMDTLRRIASALGYDLASLIK